MSLATRASLAALLLAAPLAGGCALFGRSDPVVARYFTIDPQPAAPQSAHPELRLRLGHVEGWSHLRERLVARDADGELVFYDDWRWTERPETYLRRALARALFEERGVVPVVAGSALALDVELTSFEELQKPAHVIRVQAHLVVRDDRIGLVEESFTFDQPVSCAEADQPPSSECAKRPAALVDAYTQGLNRSAEQIADHVVAKLAALPPQDASSPGRAP